MLEKCEPDRMGVNDGSRNPRRDRGSPKRRRTDTPGSGYKSCPLPMAGDTTAKPGGWPARAADPDRQPVGGKAMSLAALKQRESDLIGGLSKPDPMPWFAWSISAELCNVGSRLRTVPGSVCSKCYALKENYSYAKTRRAMERRYAFLADLDRWANNMANCLVARAAKFIPEPADRWPAFRWFDSGDIQSPEHLDTICRVAERTQEVTLADGTSGDIRHWLPTHEYPAVRKFVARGGVFPRNMCVRVSAPLIDGIPIVLAGLPVSTTHSRPADAVYPEAFACPSDAQGGSCGSCRACWDSDMSHVSYPLH